MLLSEKKFLNNQYFAIFGDDWDQKMEKSYPFEKIDILLIAFAHTREKDSFQILGYEEAHSSQDQKTDKQRIFELSEKARKQNPQIKIVISLGWGQNDYSNAAKTPQKFAQSVADFIEEHFLDGIDLDYEIEKDDISLKDFQILVQTIHDTLKPLNKILIITPDQSSLKAWDGQLVNQLFDYIQIQTYWKNRWHYIQLFLNTGISSSKTLIGVCTEDKEDSLEYFEYIQKYKLAGIFAWRMDTDDNLKGIHQIINTIENNNLSSE